MSSVKLSAVIVIESSELLGEPITVFIGFLPDWDDHKLFLKHLDLSTLFVITFFCIEVLGLCDFPAHFGLFCFSSLKLFILLLIDLFLSLEPVIKSEVESLELLFAVEIIRVLNVDRQLNSALDDILVGEECHTERREGVRHQPQVQAAQDSTNAHHCLPQLGDVEVDHLSQRLTWHRVSQDSVNVIVVRSICAQAKQDWGKVYLNIVREETFLKDAFLTLDFSEERIIFVDLVRCAPSVHRALLLFCLVLIWALLTFIAIISLVADAQKQTFRLCLLDSVTTFIEVLFLQVFLFFVKEEELISVCGVKEHKPLLRVAKFIMHDDDVWHVEVRDALDCAFSRMPEADGGQHFRVPISVALGSSESFTVHAWLPAANLQHTDHLVGTVLMLLPFL